MHRWCFCQPLPPRDNHHLFKQIHMTKHLLKPLLSLSTENCCSLTASSATMNFSKPPCYAAARVKIIRGYPADEDRRADRRPRRSRRHCCAHGGDPAAERDT